MVVPVFNESSQILISLTRILEFVDACDVAGEILIVDDGSSDETLSIAREFARGTPNITVIAENHRGKAYAVLSGMRQARGSIVGFMDIDLATPLDTFALCREAIEQGAGVTIASREGPGARRVNEPLYRHIMGRVFNGFVRLLILPRILDTQCGFKFFSRDAVDSILSRCQIYRDAEVISAPRVTGCDAELLFIARKRGYRIAMIPVTWYYSDQSKVNPIPDTLQNMRDILSVRINGWRGLYN